MNGFYIRWAIIVLLGVGLFVVGLMRYRDQVSTVTPEALLRDRPAGSVRLMGMVVAGSLVKHPEEKEFRFTLKGPDQEIPVRYTGEDPESLRELKTLVVTGRLDAESQLFQGDKISVVPNYGFITSAYLVSVIPLAIFLFAMERRVRLLYQEIKGTTVYEPEKVFDNE